MDHSFILVRASIFYKYLNNKELIVAIQFTLALSFRR
jgi:hypothetical protein